MQEDSLKKRYFSRLSSRVIQFLIGFITIGIVPRSLGDEMYGNLGFLTSSFRNLFKFLRLGIPGTYYVKISNRPQEKSIISFYFSYVFFVITILFIFLTFLIIFDKEYIFFPGQKNSFILLAGILAALNFFNDSIRLTTDAYALTHSFELILMFKVIMVAVVILTSSYYDLLNLENYFIINTFFLSLLIMGGAFIIFKNKVIIIKKIFITKDQFLTYCREFYKFASPLVIVSILVMPVLMLDRWLLQSFYGSIEQSYYTLALAISGVVYILPSASSELILREMSAVSKKNNNEKLERLFKKYFPPFFLVSVYFGVFISNNAESIILIFLGEEFRKSHFVISFLVLGTSFQALSSFTSNIIMAKEKTSLLRNIGIFTTFTALFSSFILIFPIKYGGLNLGAIGLSIKMLIHQFLIANIYLYYCSKILNFKFYVYLFCQFIIFIIFGTISFCSKIFTSHFIENMFFNFILDGLLYSTVVIVLVISFPRFFMLKQKDINNFIIFFKEKVKNFKR